MVLFKTKQTKYDVSEVTVTFSLLRQTTIFPSETGMQVQTRTQIEKGL